ncbi:MAG: hypothetical protein P8P74_06665 [Crocinitomicaceae bacterium]|nr:hypothetical protein [Crocinitomicaceae bacterium]
MRWRFVALVIWGISVSIIPSTNQPRPVFGVRVSIGANSMLTTYVCYINTGRNLTHKRVCDRETFIKIVSGHWPSIYNPKRENLFDENGLSCNVIKDSITLKDIPSCVPFDSLWKIRYSVYPFRNRNDVGWSNKYHKPSLLQEKYLGNRYGIKHIDGDFFLDTSFWMLLKDVTDPDWIANYKSLN